MTNFGWTNKEEIFLLTSVGNQKTKFNKRDYTPVEVGEKFQKAISNGASNKDIATFLSVDTALVGRFLKIYNDLDKKYHHLISFQPVPNGKIAFDQAREIARFSKKDQSKLISALLEFKFNRQQIQSVYQQLERTNKKITDIIEEISKRTGGQRRLLIMGLISEEINKEIKDYKSEDLELLSRQTLNSKNLNNYLLKQNIKVENLFIGKNTFSLVVFRTSVKQTIIEELSEIILDELKNELK